MNETQKAPGKHDRKGLSLMELYNKFPNDRQTGQWFVAARWPAGIECPHCGSAKVLTGARHPSQPCRCRDQGCQKRFGVKTRTVMESSNLGYRVWALAVYRLTTSLKNVSSMKLHRDLGITQKSAWLSAHKIRKAYEQVEPMFGGVVEVDECHVGGPEKNKHADKRLRAGRGAVGKATVVGVKERGGNQVHAQFIGDTKRGSLHRFITKHVQAGSIVCTDDLKSYRGMEGYDHRVVKHSVGEYVAGDAHINGVESFGAVIKRACKGVFHRLSHKHLQRYVLEFVGKHNIRDRDTVDQMRWLVEGMVGKRLRYADLIGGAGSCQLAIQG